MGWKDMEGLPLSTAIFPGSGRLDGGYLGTIGDSWLWGSGGAVCLWLTAAPLRSGLELPSPPSAPCPPYPHTKLPPDFTPARG